MNAPEPRDIIADAILIRAFGTRRDHADDAIAALTAAGWTLAPPASSSAVTGVTKISGSSWTGRVCGTYSTSLTPEGYNVESENEPGSVQIYPAAALRALAEAKP